jgi:hypothetical protein
MRRLWVIIRAYFRPRWRTLQCPQCNLFVRARSGPHMTAAVGRHNREYHPGYVPRSPFA